MELFLPHIQLSGNIWEPCSGGGHLTEVLKQHGFNVYSSDITDRGCQDEVFDFLQTAKTFNGDILTNPPYKYAQAFVEKALECVSVGNKVVMFLRVLFLEGKKRSFLFKKHPPKEVWITSSRISCAKNGDFETYDSSAQAYAWFVWEKGYQGDTIVKWFN